jgi:hypothetical protein
MGMLSLATAVEEVNEAFFLGLPLTPARRRSLAKAVAGRQGLVGSYAGMPAPTDRDFAEGVRVFTGEAIRSRGGVAHVLGEEACRALILLDVADPTVRSAMDSASQGMLECLEKSRRREANMGRKWRGVFCCARCTCALWRHFAVGGLRDAEPEQWLHAGLAELRVHRTGNGRWRRFPLFYTLLALSEMDRPDAVKECRHAAPSCERLLRGQPTVNDRFAKRRRLVAERILARS